MKIFSRVVFLSFLICQLYAEPINITVAGTGVTGLWTAYTICKDLEESGKGDLAALTIIGKWDWLSALASEQHTKVFHHEASGFGPVGIQPHSGLIWNTDNEVVSLVKNGIGKPEMAFYTSLELEEEGREFLELYAGWHARHLDKQDKASSYQRQKTLISINRYARGLWADFNSERELTKNPEPLFLHLKGAWRLYDSEVQYNNALNSLSILGDFNYSATAVDQKEEIAKSLPFYKEIIASHPIKGIFFPDDGLIDSNQLRKILWKFLSQERSGKPQVTFRLNEEVSDISLTSEGVCQGVLLSSGEVVKADITIFSMGLANKPLLAKQGIELPLWNIWGAAVKAKLIDSPENAPREGVCWGVSFHSQRCITALLGNDTVIIAGTSMVVPKTEAPTPDLYEEKLTKSLHGIFKGRFDESSLKFYVAPRTGIADDLPIIDLEYEIPGAIVLNPTSHLGNTQSIALGKIASLHVLQLLGSPYVLPSGLNLQEYRLNRFQKDIEQVRKDRQNDKRILF